MTLSLVERFGALTATAEREYFATLVRGAGGAAALVDKDAACEPTGCGADRGSAAGAAGAAAIAASPALTPLEAVVTRRLGGSISAFQRCWDQLGAADAARAAAAGEGAAGIRRAGPTAAECRGLLVQALDDYLAEFLPAPNLVPVAVSVTVPSLGRDIAGLVVRPGDGVLGVMSWVLDRLREDGVEAVGWADGATLHLRNPGAEAALLDHGAVLQLGARVLPGAAFIVEGDVMREADLPAACIRHTFDKASPTPQDYWTCNTCSMNWVCVGCRRKCHAGHDLVPFLQQHTPSWGCCYCKKKGVCQLLGRASLAAAAAAAPSDELPAKKRPSKPLPPLSLLAEGDAGIDSATVARRRAFVSEGRRT
mmetsp:Transcript_22138/g.66493  ORF Transcript_22138/g.66493 Transcript_22138/m.66493 type:complete len:366 (-) Transcript_22138:1617-2714(-)